MVVPLKGRELLRLSVLWPWRIKTDTGEVDGETRNITSEGLFLYCPERLREGIVYPMTIELPEKQAEMRGKVTWSNLDTCTSLNINSRIGFYFLRIDEDQGRQSLRAAIVVECRKPLRLREGDHQLTDSPSPSKTQVIASLENPLDY
jgi:hypothetical protein